MSKTIAQNRKTRYNYTIGDEFEAGIVLIGSEVKSLRLGHCSIAESYISIEDGEAFLINAHIDLYEHRSMFIEQEPRRKRKLLLHKREIKKLLAKSQKEGYTIISLSMYFNNSGKVKIKIATAKGKKNYDKRETEKRRDWERDKRNLIGKG